MTVEQRTPTAIDNVAEAWVDTQIALFPEYWFPKLAPTWAAPR